MESRSLTVRGVELTFLEVGKGPLALCLHGFPDTAHTWRHLGPRLAEAGFHAVAPFNRGYAPSAVPADGLHQTGALAADANALQPLYDAILALGTPDAQQLGAVAAIDDTLAAMGHTGQDTLQVSRPWQQDAYGADVGDIYLVYGNDGHDVIADNTEEIHPRPKFDALRKIMEEIGAFADGLAAEATS